MLQQVLDLLKKSDQTCSPKEIEKLSVNVENRVRLLKKELRKAITSTTPADTKLDQQKIEAILITMLNDVDSDKRV